MTDAMDFTIDSSNPLLHLPHPIPLAILDDYHSIASPFFSSIPATTLSITTFTSTLPPSPALAARLAPFAILVTMRERTALTSELVKKLPNLKVVLATGGNLGSWDLEALREQGVRVYCAPGKGRTDGKGRYGKSVGMGGGGKMGEDVKVAPKKYTAHHTTQHVWALILALARNIPADDSALKSKATAWQSVFAIPLVGKTLGIVGLGRLGVEVARIGVVAFGMRVIAWSQNLTQDAADEKAREAGLGVRDEEGRPVFEVASKERLFREADVLSLHYVLSERSRGLVGARELGWMKRDALLINTARGPLIDEAALLSALRTRQIAGAALDVFDVEPLPLDSPWRTEKWDEKEGKARVVLSPHMGYVERETLGVWYEEVVECLERLVEGREGLWRRV